MAVPANKSVKAKSNMPHDDSKKSSRKRAVDFLDADEVAAKKVKKSKSANLHLSKPKKTEMKARKEKKLEPVGLPTKDDEEEGEEEDFSNIADPSAFASAFDSDSESEQSDTNPEQVVPRLPANIERQVAKANKHKREDGEPAVLYIGRIPRGFHEQQMRQYFSQFGNVTRLRLCRNKKTGQSKHFGFIEFDNAEVADIVQRAMHNYLLFGHILQVKLVPAEQVHPDLFKGANKRFKQIPWGNIRARAMKQPATREVWEKRVEREQERRKKRADILKEYDYDFETVEIKQVKDLPSRAARLAIEPPSPKEDTQATINVADTLAKPNKKDKKAKKNT